jgi:hypothetical protein
LAFDGRSGPLEAAEAGAPKVKPCEGLADLFEGSINSKETGVSNPGDVVVEGANRFFQMEARTWLRYIFVRERKTRTPPKEQSFNPVGGCFESSSSLLRRFMPILNEVGSISGLVAGPGAMSFATTMVIDAAPLTR